MRVEVPREAPQRRALVGVEPADDVGWTGEIDQAEQTIAAWIARHPEVRSKELWIEERVDPAARSALEARGWTVQEQAGLTVAKAQADSGSGAGTGAGAKAIQMAPKP